MKLLDACWIHLRLKYLALAEGPTSSTEGRIKGGGSKSRPPRRAGDDLRELERRWRACKTDSERKQVLQDGLNDWHRYMDSKPKEKPGTEDYKREAANDPRPSRQVARIYKVSQTTVMNWRKQYGE